jgi:dTDP-4-dehydrorhamnose reductase
MKILITGASGLLGLNLTLTAQARGAEITAAYAHHPIRVPGVQTEKQDLADGRALAELVNRVRPDWTVHCAALTNVDWCEAHAEAARFFHEDVSRNLANAVRNTGGSLVYISTDAVFDGVRGDYSEADPCVPLNTYALTKLAGESAAREVLPAALVVRTNFYGWKLEGQPGLAEWVLRELEADHPVPGFVDVIFTPMLANDLSEVLLDMMERRLEGVYHIGNSQPCSKFDFARVLARVFGLSESLVQPTSVARSSLRAPRPKNTSLRTDKAVAALGRPMTDLLPAVERFRAFRDSGFINQIKRARGGPGDATV